MTIMIIYFWILFSITLLYLGAMGFALWRSILEGDRYWRLVEYVFPGWILLAGWVIYLALRLIF